MGIDTIEPMVESGAHEPAERKPTPYERLLGRVEGLLFGLATGEMKHERDYVLRFSDTNGHSADVTIPHDELRAIDRDLWQDVEKPLEEQRVTHQINGALTKGGFELNDPASPDITVELVDTAAPV